MTGRLRVSLAPLLAATTLVTMVTSSARARADEVIAQCIVASDKGLDLRKQGKLIEARRALATCAAASCGPDISDTCQKRIAEINGALPSVVFAPKDGAGNDLTAVKLSVDGTVYADRLDGNPIVIDPGEHEFRFEAAGQPPLVKRFVLRQGEQNRREEVTIGPPAPVSAGPVASGSQAASPGPATSQPGPAPIGGPQVSSVGPDVPSGGIGTQRLLAVVAGGAGLAAVAVGSVFGILASSASNQQKSDCPSATNCPNRASALSDHSTMSSDGTTADVAFVVGGALITTGVVLFLTGDKKPAPQGSSALPLTPQVGLERAGGLSLKLSGEF